VVNHQGLLFTEISRNRGAGKGNISLEQQQTRKIECPSEKKGKEQRKCNRSGILHHEVPLDVSAAEKEGEQYALKNRGEAARIGGSVRSKR